MTVAVVLGIEHRQADWKTFLVNKLVGAKTLPENFRHKVNRRLERPTDMREGLVGVDSSVPSVSVQEEHAPGSDRQISSIAYACG